MKTQQARQGKQLVALVATLGALAVSVGLASGGLSAGQDQRQAVTQQQQQQRRSAAADAAAVGQTALTADEWHQLYLCPLAQQTNVTDQMDHETKLRHIKRHAVPWYQQLWFDFMSECNRDQLSWRFLYVDELLDGFKVLLKDSSLNERLANIVYSVNANGLVDLSYYKFNSGDSWRDRANEARVAGAQVDPVQCSRDLIQMERQLAELQDRLESIRAGRSNGSASQMESRHIRLARALDSFGRYESGALSGHTRILGSYAQCIDTRLERRPEFGGIGGAGGGGQLFAPEVPNEMPLRYCWASLSLRDQVNERIRARQRGRYETGDETLAVAVCLPRSCHTTSSNQHKQLVQRLLDSQFTLPQSMYVEQHLKIDSLFCLPDHDGPFGLPTSGQLWLAFVFVWLLVCLAITYLRTGEPPRHLHEELDQVKEQQMAIVVDPVKHQHQQQQQQQQEIQRQERRPSNWYRAAQCFNLRLSWRDFTSDKRELKATDRVELDVLNPIKILLIVFAVASHSVLMSASISDNQIKIAAYVERDQMLQAALLASVIIDTLFVISGILLSYITCTKLAAGFGVGRKVRKAPSNSVAAAAADDSPVYFFANWLVLAANRYLRLVPLYAFMFWFRRDVLTYLGSGPLWDFGFNRETMNGACAQESWLLPFSFLSAFVPLSRQCFVPSWSISNDILFGLLIPPFLLGLQRRTARRLTINLMIAISLAFSLATVFIYSQTPPQDRYELNNWRLHGIVMFFTSLSQVYTWPYYRVPSFMIGAIAGYALFRYSTKTLAGESPDSWPKWLTGLATKAAIAYVTGHTVVGLCATPLKIFMVPYHQLFLTHMMTLDRPLWAASNAVLFLRMTTDWRHGPWMREFASQRWRTLARLNYATIFVHWIFLIVSTGVMTSLPSFTLWQMFAAFSSVYVATIPFASLLHVVFENPAEKLIKKMLFGL